MERTLQRPRVIDVGVITLTLLTAGLHLLHASHLPLALGWLLYANAAGYIVLLGLLYWTPASPRWHRRTRQLLLGYTALTIGLYVLFGLVTGLWAIPLGPLDKLVEVALLTLLWQQHVDSVATSPSVSGDTRP